MTVYRRQKIGEYLAGLEATIEHVRRVQVRLNRPGFRQYEIDSCVEAIVNLKAKMRANGKRRSHAMPASW